MHIVANLEVDEDLTWFFWDGDFVAEWLPDLDEYGVDYIDYEEKNPPDHRSSPATLTAMHIGSDGRIIIPLRITSRERYNYHTLQTFLRDTCNALDNVRHLNLTENRRP